MSLSEEQKKKLYEENAMSDAHKRSYETRDSGSFKDIFDRGKCGNITFWKPVPNEHIIEILPWFAGENYPYIQGRKLKEGTPTYLVDVYVHRNVGANDDQYICLAKSYNKPCPICEFRNSGDLSAEEVEALRPKRRTVYAIWDRDAESKGVQVWEVAHWYMEKKLQYRAKRPRGGGFINYSHAKLGRSISFTITAIGKNREYEGHDFIERESPIPEEILEKVPCLDELLYIPEYKEVQDAFLGGMSDKGEEEIQPIEEESPYTIATGTTPILPEVGEVKVRICPIGQKFGQDFDEFEDCDGCSVRADCEKAKEGEVEPPPPVLPTRRHKRHES
jgi:hypothetical protein